MSDAVSSFIGLSLPVLAQLAPAGGDSNAAAWWLIGLAAVAVAFNAVSSAWIRITGRFQEKRGDGPEYQRREDCIELHKDLTTVLDRMNREHADRTEALRKEIKADISQVYERIEEKTDAQTSRLTAISQFMGDIAGQVKRIANGGNHAAS